MPIFRRVRRQRDTESPEPQDEESTIVRETAPLVRGPNLVERLREIAAAGGLPEDALEPALQAVIEATGAGAGALCLFDVRHGILRLATEVGLSDEGCRRLRSVRRGDPACWDMPLHGLLNRRAYLIENASRNRYVPELLPTRAEIRTVVCVPLYADFVPLGSLVLLTIAPRAFAERDVQTLWKPLQELVRMIEAVRRQAGVGGPVDLPGARVLAPSVDVVTLTAERDRLQVEVETLRTDGERLAVQVRAHESERARLERALADLTSNEESLRAELTRVGAEAERATRLAAAVEAAEGERQRLAAALEAAAARQAEQVQRETTLEEARSDAERAARAYAAELEQVRRGRRDETALAERLAREREAEVDRLQRRVTEAESALASERQRGQEWQVELTRLAAAQEAATAREQHLREELEAALAGQRAVADADFEGAVQRAHQAEEARASAEALVGATRTELATAHASIEALEAEATRANEEVARLQGVEQAAQVERAALLERIATLEAAERAAIAKYEGAVQEMAALRAEYDKVVAGHRRHEADQASADARLEAVSAERDQMRAQLTAREEATARQQSELQARQARLERELTEQTAAVERLAAERDELRIERETLLARLAEAEAEAPAPVAIPAPDVAEAEPDVHVIEVTEKVRAVPALVPGVPTIAVLDVDQSWTDAAVADHQVTVLAPDGAAGEQITMLQPERVVVNLAAPGALQALVAIRAAGCTARFWGCIADPRNGRGLALGPVEPAVAPLDPDAVIEALGPYAAAGGRVVTTGADVDALMSLRQALSRRRVSVSMAWDGKQAADLLGVVKPLAVVVDLDLPRRDGYTVIAGLDQVDPVPFAVVVGGTDDAPAALLAQLGDPTVARRAVPLAEMLTQLAARPEVTPVVERRQKVRAITGTGR